MTHKKKRREFLKFGLTSLVVSSVPINLAGANTTQEKTQLESVTNQRFDINSVYPVPSNLTFNTSDKIVIFSYINPTVCIILTGDSKLFFDRYVDGVSSLQGIIDHCKKEYYFVEDIDKKATNFFKALLFSNALPVYAHNSLKKLSTTQNNTNRCALAGRNLELSIGFSSYENGYELLSYNDIPEQTLAPLNLNNKNPNSSRGFIELHVDYDRCIGCGKCKSVCPEPNVFTLEFGLFGVVVYVEVSLCIGCGRCERVCPVQGITIDIS